MGHGDELAIVDANFPAASVGRRVVELRGATSPEVLDAVLTVFPLDTYVVPAVLTMQVVGDPDAVPEPVADFAAALSDHGLGDCEIGAARAQRVLRAGAQRVRDRAHRRAAAVRQHPAGQGRRQQLSP